MTNLTVPVDYVTDLRFEEIIYADEIKEGTIYILAASSFGCPPRIWATATKIRIVGEFVRLVAVYPDETASSEMFALATPLIVKRDVP
jgi:hypothetical protein